MSNHNKNMSSKLPLGLCGNSALSTSCKQIAFHLNLNGVLSWPKTLVPLYKQNGIGSTYLVYLTLDVVNQIIAWNTPLKSQVEIGRQSNSKVTKDSLQSTYQLMTSRIRNSRPIHSPTQYFWVVFLEKNDVLDWQPMLQLFKNVNQIVLVEISSDSARGKNRGLLYVKPVKFGKDDYLKKLTCFFPLSSS